MLKIESEYSGHTLNQSYFPGMPLKHNKRQLNTSQINMTCLESQQAAGGKPVGCLESVATEFSVNRTSERVSAY